MQSKSKENTWTERDLTDAIQVQVFGIFLLMSVDWFNIYCKLYYRHYIYILSENGVNVQLVTVH